jgi:hypothetical protein
VKIRIAALLVSLVTITSVGAMNIASAASGPPAPVTTNQGSYIGPETPAVEAPKDEAATTALLTKPEPAKSAPVATSVQQSAPARTVSAPVVEDAPVKSGCN